MASVQYIFGESNSLRLELKQKQQILTDLIWLREENVVIIQKTWRMFHQLIQYRYIRSCIIVIQKYLRGWLTRKNMDHFVAQLESDMDESKRRKAAITIQAAWRGYYARKLLRKQGRDLSQIREEKKKIGEATTQMQGTFRERFSKMKDELDKYKFEEEKEAVLHILFKCHHLLRTHQITGIYSCNCCTKFTIIERLMKEMPLKLYMKELRKNYTKLNKLPKPEPPYIFKNKRLQRFEDTFRLRDKNQELRPEPPPVGCNINKRFNLSTKLPKERYQREFMRMGKYEEYKPCEREYDASKNITFEEFLLCGEMDLKNKTLPYHIDFWQKNSCAMHNIIE